MIYPPYCLRISDDTRKILDICKSEYGADAGLNRFIEALGQFCLTGSEIIDGIHIKEFFDDALAGKLAAAGSMRKRLAAADEEQYTRFSGFLDSDDIGSSVLRMMCEKSSAAEFFQAYPKWLYVIQEQFLQSENGLPLRESVIKQYTERWYQARLADGSAAEQLKENIKSRMNCRRDDEE